MNCPSCSADNRADARFCLVCGAKLTLSCVGCGRELPPIAHFCDACGTAVGSTKVEHAVSDPRSYTPNHLATKILTGRSALEGERKQVTVLFADVAGSTALAERLDPEDVHEIMDQCFRLLMEEVHRYEGTINQFTGDGIMALFGAPIAHEDAAERAVRAALGMQAALTRYGDQLQRERGIDFQMRIGINSGMVVVGKIGDDLRMDYTAVGDTTNLAARLQGAAMPGHILISEPTAKLIDKRFVTQAVGPLRLKGKSQPVVAYDVVRVLRRPPLLAPSEHGLTPLIGRAGELSTLQTLFAQTRAGRGQVVFVVGEAGIGKSRLIHEFQQQVADEATWLDGRCISFGRGMPFLPVIDMLKTACAVDEGDEEAVIIGKIRQALAPLGAEAAQAEPYIRFLLAADPGDPAVLQMNAGARRFATFDALKRLVLSFAAQRPLVLLVEDLHWIDPPSEEFLRYLVDAVAGVRLVLLCTFRPGYHPAIGERSYVTRLALQPLSADETTCMTAAMLQTAALPAEIAALIVKKAEGNPFFIEEVTKSLLEIGALRRTADSLVLARPVEEIVIPDAIQDVIMARLDRLGDDSKRAIQIASVIGREFVIRLLQRASQLGDSVHRLVDELRAVELIYEKSDVPEVAYMFKHALTHDVAYESLLLQRRKLLHRSIGQAIEELYADRLTEYWETLAHHYYRAEEWPAAFAYLVKAGDKAREAFANREAVHFYDLAAEVAQHLTIEPAQSAALLRGRAHALLALSDFTGAVAAYRAALELMPATADRTRLQADLAHALFMAHDFDAAVDVARDVLASATAAGSVEAVTLANFTIGNVHCVRGQLDDGEACLTAAVRLASGVGRSALQPRIEVFRRLIANWQGDYSAALEAFDSILETLRGANELMWLAEAYSHMALPLAGGGQYQRALDCLQKGIALAEAIGDKVWRARMWNTSGWIFGDLGAWEQAEEANRRCLEITEQMGSTRMVAERIANAALNLADAALTLGQPADAAAHLESVGSILADPYNEWMTWRYGMHCNVTIAEWALAHGDLPRARTHLDLVLNVAQRTRSRRYLVRARRGLAACHVAAGDLANAEAVLRAVVEDARALRNPPQLWHTLVAYGRVLHSLGRSAAASAAWREGLAVVNATNAELPIEMAPHFHASPVSLTLQELTS